MKREGIKEFLIINGEIEKVIETEIFDKITKPSIYEVIRVIDGVPIFIEDHLERLKKSIKLANYTLDRTDIEIKNDVKKLIKINNIKNLNIKLLFTKIEEIGNVILIYVIESYYPEPKLYKTGIHTILFYYERKKPNIKIIDEDFKKTIEKRLDETTAFEAILVDKDGYITEGSRSNIFFVKGDKIYTVPGRKILLGITRGKVLEVSNELNIEVIEKNVHLEDLDIIDGAFITGTSINVLPITTIENKKLNSVNNCIIKRLSRGYLEKVYNYLQN